VTGSSGPSTPLTKSTSSMLRRVFQVVHAEIVEPMGERRVVLLFTVKSHHDLGVPASLRSGNSHYILDTIFAPENAT